MAAEDERAAKKIGRRAQQAFVQGRRVFAPRLTNPHPSWARQIETIEAEGWRLEHWALSLNTWFVTVAHPVFRRADG